MESHYICPFRYHLGLCIEKFTKNALTLATQKSPLEFSLSFSHTHFGLPKGFNWNFSPIVTVTFLWESTSPPGFCMFHLPFVSSQSTQWVMLTVAKENPRRPVLNESPGQPLFEKLCVIKNRLNVFFFSWCLSSLRAITGTKTGSSKTNATFWTSYKIFLLFKYPLIFYLHSYRCCSR